jgi:CDGSH-type Zn-finger protein
MAEPVVAQKAPYKASLEAGKDYWWCACGRSARQPFCDGSHKGTGLDPRKFSAGETKDYYLCGCKATRNNPFCDGTHKAI